MDQRQQRLAAGKLPRASLLRVKFSIEPWYYAKFRLANAMRLQIGGLMIQFRMPWLPHVAKRLHPEIYARSCKRTEG